MNTSYIAGIDAGSVSVKIALTDGEGRLVHGRYERHGGRSQEKMLEMLEELLAERPGTRLAFTGSAARLAAGALDCPFISELSSFSESTAALYPDVHTIIEMGGEDSKLIFLGESGIEDFALNSVCAAGTGSFLDQQAERMNLSIEEFAELALGSEHPPRIAGRCSVFAKSDMIHLQQIAAPLEDIVAGLCFAVARNFKGSIVRGRPLRPKVAFMGGVALNAGMVRAFREIFELDELVIPERPTLMGALGAAAKARRDGSARAVDLEVFRGEVEELARSDRPKKPLAAEGDRFRERHMQGSRDLLFQPDGSPRTMDKPVDKPKAPVPAYMGIDVGSISTNLAVIDEQGRLLGKRYLMTASRPIEAVKTGLAELREELGGCVEIRGAGATGSGRYMIADFTAADVVKNEITAHARAAAFIDPAVDTIFEIGGQDSKYVSLSKGVIADFTMNKACAAGTGSFLEEQAEKLSVNIKGEFQELALSAKEPSRLGERCTVFMENSLMSSLSMGTGKEDLLAGLAYSIVENYLNRVVEGRKVGENVFFQGGTAFNKAVVAAFEKYLGREVTVPPNHDVAGAIGMALIARDHVREQGIERSGFKGFELADADYSQSSFTCDGCENQCEINRLKIEGRKGFLFYGGRCEKYDVNRTAAKDKPESLFRFREAELTRSHRLRKQAFEEKGGPAGRGRIGLPYAFFMHDYMPYYATLLWELGFEPVMADRTSRAITKLGVETVLAETCFPVKASLGHVRHLLEEGVTTQFIPSFINMSPPDSDFESGLSCPLTQSFPYQARAAFPEAEIIAPPLSHRGPEKQNRAALKKHLARFGIGGGELRRAMAAAAESQAAFERAIREKGRQVLADLPERAVVIIGRPYNAFDPGLNLDVPEKLATLGVTSIPMDFLPEEDIHADWREMYWRSGQRMLSATRFTRKHPRLYPLFVGSFSCGPDTFIFKFIERELGDKPDLHLEIDEHSADAGVITRVEAFLDSIDGNIKAGDEAPAARACEMEPLSKLRVSFREQQRLVYLPPMTDHAYGLEAAFKYCGVEAEVMPETDHEAVALAHKYVSGRECYPFAVTTGDMLKTAASPGFDRERSAFFMPSGCGPCRFGQYNIAQRLVLDRAGYPDVPIYSPMQDVQFYEDLGIVGKDFSRRSWEGVVAFDLLTKCLHETRPHAEDKAAAQEVYDHHLQRLRKVLVQSNGSLPQQLRQMRRDFEDLPRTGGKRPLIGIVGEIFVRSNRFSNEDTVRKVEELGGEAWLAPIDEWFYYINAMGMRRALRKGDYRGWLKLKLKNHFQHKIAHEQEAFFEDLLKTIHDPGTREVLGNASPYIHDSLEGEAILSVGKSLDMIERGAVGIINLMPFGCMPGTIVTALMSRVSEQFGVPAISLPFDGTDSPANRLQLEAFMEQCCQRAEDARR